MMNWKATTNRNIRKMTPDDSRAIIARIVAEGVTIFHQDIRAITGGFNSQSINAYVLRRLGIRAGIIKG